MSDTPDTPREKKCPICGKPRDPEFSPFCSRRCELVDLGRWLKGGYVIPGAPVEEERDDEE
jgi:endogenous inhibitor of DNA gyrase (YacG/DUF329 family)